MREATVACVVDEDGSVRQRFNSHNLGISVEAAMRLAMDAATQWNTNAPHLGSVKAELRER